MLSSAAITAAERASLTPRLSNECNLAYAISVIGAHGGVLHRGCQLQNPDAINLPDCPRAANGHAAAPPSELMKARRFIATPRF